MKEVDVLDVLKEQYDEADNKKEINYWTPLSNLIVESVELRGSKGMSQKELASKMGTRQSVISRFENMGRIPSYDFIARMAESFDQVPSISLAGEFTITIPLENRNAVKLAAENSGKSINDFLTDLIMDSVNDLGSDNVIEEKMSFQEPFTYTSFSKFKTKKLKEKPVCLMELVAG